MYGFTLYYTILLYATYPSGKAHAGSAIIIKNNIRYNLLNIIRKEYIPVTAITIQLNNVNLNVAAAYCPPRHNIKIDQYVALLSGFGLRFILGGDFNAKHTAWGSRLITPKDRELFNAINNCDCDYFTSRKPTYWPADNNKNPDLIDLYITKDISANYIEVENIDDLTSDHVSILMTISTTVIRKKRKRTFVNKYTDWDKFRENLDGLISLKVRLRTTEDLDALYLMDAINKAAKSSTSELPDTTAQEICYPIEIRELIRKRRKPRSNWHQSRHPDDKNTFNRIDNQLNCLIKEIKRKSFEYYTENLTANFDTNNALWKATRKFKRPVVRILPIKNECGEWMRSDLEKAELFAQHLFKVF